MTKRFIITSLLVLLTTAPAMAWYPRLQKEMIITPETVVIGHNREYITGIDETLIELARRTRIGFENLLRANPGVDPWRPVAGTRLTLPSAALLPQGVTLGITLNLAEMKIYLISDEGGHRRVRIYPVGIGRDGWETPLGDFHVQVIIDNPDWTPPASLREEDPELPGIVPPGPDNPLGSHWIGLSAPGVGIHGSNQPLGVGRKVSHGCLRLYPQDIVDLAERVTPGTPVRIIDQPVKHSLQNGELYLEVHRRVNTLNGLDFPLANWNSEVIAQVLQEARGLPVKIPARK